MVVFSANAGIFACVAARQEKNKVVALLEAYYNTNIRSTLGSFTVKLPSAKRHGKFVCPVRAHTL